MFRWEPVLSAWYGRWRLAPTKKQPYIQPTWTYQTMNMRLCKHEWPQKASSRSWKTESTCVVMGSSSTQTIRHKCKALLSTCGVFSRDYDTFLTPKLGLSLQRRTMSCEIWDIRIWMPFSLFTVSTHFWEELKQAYGFAVFRNIPKVCGCPWSVHNAKSNLDYKKKTLGHTVSVSSMDYRCEDRNKNGHVKRRH